MTDGAAFQRAGLLLAGFVLALHGTATLRALGPSPPTVQAEVLEVTLGPSGPALLEVRVPEAPGRGRVRAVVVPRTRGHTLHPGAPLAVTEDHGQLLPTPEAQARRASSRARAWGWVALGAVGWLLALGSILWSRRRVATIHGGSTPRSGDGPGLQNR